MQVKQHKPPQPLLEDLGLVLGDDEAAAFTVKFWRMVSLYVYAYVYVYGYECITCCTCWLDSQCTCFYNLRMYVVADIVRAAEDQPREQKCSIDSQADI